MTPTPPTLSPIVLVYKSMEKSGYSYHSEDGVCGGGGQGDGKGEQGKGGRGRGAGGEGKGVGGVSTT